MLREKLTFSIEDLLKDDIGQWNGRMEFFTRTIVINTRLYYTTLLYYQKIKINIFLLESREKW